MCLTWRPRCSRFPNLLYRGFLTRKRFAASKASELATVLPIGNRRYGRFGNLRYVQRALNRYGAAVGLRHKKSESRSGERKFRNSVAPDGAFGGSAFFPTAH